MLPTPVKKDGLTNELYVLYCFLFLIEKELIEVIFATSQDKIAY